MLIRSVDDIDESVVRALLARAAEHERGTATVDVGRNRLLGLLFLEASLRTRVGFTAAAARLGVQSVTVDAARSGPRSMPESWTHTLRTMAGYVDLVVTRPGDPLTAAALPPDLAIPVLSGGDAGPAAEHPSQALIDLFALHRLVGDVGGARVAVVGDLRMRSVRSLLRLLERTPPRELVLITEQELLTGFELPAGLTARTSFRRLETLGDVEAIYVAGIPHGALDENGRTALRVTGDHLAGLPAQTVLLSPLPVIDEVSPEVLTDKRTRFFQQSDWGLYVRMAMLEWLLNAG